MATRDDAMLPGAAPRRAAAVAAPPTSAISRQRRADDGRTGSMKAKLNCS